VKFYNEINNSLCNYCTQASGKVITLRAPQPISFYNYYLVYLNYDLKKSAKVTNIFCLNIPRKINKQSSSPFTSSYEIAIGSKKVLGLHNADSKLFQPIWCNQNLILILSPTDHLTHFSRLFAGRHHFHIGIFGKITPK